MTPSTQPSTTTATVPLATYLAQPANLRPIPAAWHTALPLIEAANAANLSAVATLGKGTITDFALSATDNLLVATTPLGIYIYQIDTLAEQRFIQTNAPTQIITLSPDGTTMAAALESHEIHLWDVATGRLQHSFTSPTERIYQLAFSPDGHLLAAISGDNRLRAWEVLRGQELYEREVFPLAHMTFSPDGRWLATGGGKWNRQVQLYDAASGQITAKTEIIPDLLEMSFSPNSETLALLPSGQPPVTAVLWDFEGAQIRRLEQAEDLHSLAWSPDGRLLATGNLKGTAQLWDVSSGDLRHTFEPQDDYISSILFSPDGKLLLSGDGTAIKIWETVSGTLEHNLRQFDATQSTFSADGRFLAFRRGGSVGLLDLTANQFRFLPGHSDQIVTLVFSPDNRWLAVGDLSGLVHVWDTSSKQPVQVLDEHTGPVGSLAFHPDGRLLATAGINEDHTAHLWVMPQTMNAAPGKAQPTKSYSISSGYPLTDLNFTPDGRWLAGGDLTGVTLRDLSNDQLLHLSGHSQPVLSLAISPDGTRAASGSFDETVIVWDLAAAQPLYTLPGHSLGASRLIFSPDGRWLITGDQQGVIRRWTVETGELKYSFNGRGDVALHPVGDLLAFKKTDDTVTVIDAFKEQAVKQLPGEHPLRFDPTGRLLAVGSDEGIITLWGVQ